MDKKRISSILIILVILAILVLLSGCKSTKYNIKPLEGTDDFDAGSSFQFTISPDNRWMVYNQDVFSPFEAGLIILNLNDKKKTRFNITMEEAAELTLGGNACWSEDSKYCVILSPETGYSSIGLYPEMIIDVSNPNKPKLIRQQSTIYEEQKSYLKYSDISQGRFTCSDCYNKASEEGLLKTYIDESHLSFVSNTPLHENAYNILSHDNKKLYYQKDHN